MYAFVIDVFYRWLKYQAMGERIAGTKMVPFKVPLTEVRELKYVYIIKLLVYFSVNIAI